MGFYVCIALGPLRTELNATKPKSKYKSKTVQIQSKPITKLANRLLQKYCIFVQYKEGDYTLFSSSLLKTKSVSKNATRQAIQLNHVR